MPEVTVEVGGRVYRLGCGEGEEAHLAELAQKIDTEARRLTRAMGTMAEGRLMLMAALIVADKLAEAEAELVRTEKKLAEARRLAEQRAAAPDLFGPEREAEIGARVAKLAERIEALSAAG